MGSRQKGAEKEREGMAMSTSRDWWWEPCHGLHDHTGGGVPLTRTMVRSVEMGIVRRAGRSGIAWFTCRGRG
jgi:hypothetical protein